MIIVLILAWWNGVMVWLVVEVEAAKISGEPKQYVATHVSANLICLVHVIHLHQELPLFVAVLFTQIENKLHNFMFVFLVVILA